MAALHKVLCQNQIKPVVTFRTSDFNVGPDQDVFLVLPKSEVSNINAEYVLNKRDMDAPLAANASVGEIQLYDADKLLSHWPLVNLNRVDKGGGRVGDSLSRKLRF